MMITHIDNLQSTNYILKTKMFARVQLKLYIYASNSHCSTMFLYSPHQQSIPIHAFNYVSKLQYKVLFAQPASVIIHVVTSLARYDSSKFGRVFKFPLSIPPSGCCQRLPAQTRCFPSAPRCHRHPISYQGSCDEVEGR